MGTTDPDADDTKASAEIYANSHEPFPVNTRVAPADNLRADLDIAYDGRNRSVSPRSILVE